MKTTRIITYTLAAAFALAVPAQAAKTLELWVMPNGTNPQALVNERL